MQPYNHQQSLGHLTGLASRLFNRLLTLRFKQAGIDMTAEQWGVIVLLQQHQPITQRQLSEWLYLEKSSVSRSIDGLERRGWIVRQAAPEDRRSKLVSLTPKSLEVVAQCAAIATQVLEDAQHDVPSTSLEQSKSSLSQVVTNLRVLADESQSESNH